MKLFHRSIESLEARIAPAALVGIDLTKLTGANGFPLENAATVAAAGDVNGDGIADLVVGDSGAHSPLISGEAERRSRNSIWRHSMARMDSTSPRQHQAFSSPVAAARATSMAMASTKFM